MIEKEPGAGDAAGSGTEGTDQGATGDDTAKTGDDESGDSGKQPA